MIIHVADVTCEEAQWYREHLPDHELSFTYGVLCVDRLLDPSRIEVLSIMGHSQVRARELDLMPNLRFIDSRCTGLNNLDIPEINARGIELSNAPDYGTNAVAEHAIALLFAVARNLTAANSRLRAGEVRVAGVPELLGFELREKQIGIVGLGHIGIRVAEMAHGLGMNVVAFDPALPQMRRGVVDRLVSLEHLLESSDVVMLCCPLNDSTRHMITTRRLRMMKASAVLINPARPGLVDARALLESLDAGVLAFAAFDGFESEADTQLAGNIEKCAKTPELELSLRLIKHAKVLVTPHMGFHTREAAHRLVECSLENIEAFLRGRLTHQIPVGASPATPATQPVQEAVRENGHRSQSAGS